MSIPTKKIRWNRDENKYEETYRDKSWEETQPFKFIIAAAGVFAGIIVAIMFLAFVYSLFVEIQAMF